MFYMVKIIADLAYKTLFGFPLIGYLGIITFLFMITTATIGYYVLKGKLKFVNHKIFAITTIILATIHALLGILIYL